MKRYKITSVLLALFAVACSTPVERSDRANLDYERGEAFFEAITTNAEAVPVVFTYDGKEYHGLGETDLLGSDVKQTKEGTRSILRYRLDDAIEITLDAFLNKEFGEVEYTLWFENKSDKTSAVLEKVSSLKTVFEGDRPVLRGCLGDHGRNYSDYVTPLDSIPAVEFTCGSGRSTHWVFPYFDIVHGDGGTLTALGWAGNWNARFEATDQGVNVNAGNNNGFVSVLLPGEKIRTALVVLLPYKGRDRDDASNLWREWFLKYNTPRADAKGTPLKPLSTTCFAPDTGLPNSDGSISERYYTWKRTLEMLIAQDIVPDFRWFDAGWYFSPDGESPFDQWYETIGSWQLDTIKWPGKTFRESNEACHKAGMKVFVWFESETVTHLESLVANHGYDPSWAKLCWKVRYLSNIGNPECREWLLARITGMMKDNAVDMYREDENVDSARGWVLFDAEEEERLGLPRKGITENKCVQGHYEIWDRIIDFCAHNGKCTFIDNCASGGGRLDIESLRRSIPMMRSDADRTTTSLRLSMTTSFCRWIPFHGANTKESEQQLEYNNMGPGSSKYVTRASWLPVYNLSEVYTHNPYLDYDNLRATFAEWKKHSHILTADMHFFTPWHAADDRTGWTSFAYHDRKTDETVIQAFRQEDCPEDSLTVYPGFLSPDRQYSLLNEDSGETMVLSGGELKEKGLQIVLAEPKSSAVWHIFPV